MSGSQRRLVALALVCLGLGPCPGPGSVPAPTGGSVLTPLVVLNPRERVLIDGWLVCIECTDHELDSVLALGSRKRPATIDTLRVDLLDGPSTVRRNHVGAQLTHAYASITAYASNHPGEPVALTQADYVALYLGNFVAVYKIRAAHALARLGGLDTRPHLDSALAVPVNVNGFRADVHRAVQYARDSVWTP